MKQTITVDQLNELSDTGKERLREWWIDRIKKQGLDVGLVRFGDLVFDPHSKPVNCFAKNGTVTLLSTKTNVLDEGVLPLFSIGQMIEFMRGTDTLVTIYTYILVLTKQTKEGLKEQTIDYTELTDALWHAVKEVLEKET